MKAKDSAQLGWLLDNLVAQVPKVLHAVVFSRDGLPVSASRGLTRENTERLSALASGLQSLARGVGEQFEGGTVRQAVIEMDSMFLFVMASGRGTCLAVLASADAQVGMIAYEMAALVRKVGARLSANPRVDPGSPHEMTPRS